MSNVTLATYIATYSVKDRHVFVEVDAHKPLWYFVQQSVYIRIGYSSLNIKYKTVFLDLALIITKEPNLDLSQSIATYLTTLTDIKVDGYTNNIIPLRDVFSRKYTRRIEAYDGFNDGDLNIQYTSFNSPSTRNDPYLKSSLPDLVITPKKRDLSNSLVSINGVFHHTQLNNNELYVKDGFLNMRTVNDKKVGIYDTTSLGGHTTIPITLDNITNTLSQDPRAGVELQFNGYDFTNKTILVVIHGYLYALDNTYKVVGMNRVKLDICKMDIINQYIHNPTTLTHTPYNIPPGYDVFTSASQGGSHNTTIEYPTVLEEMNTFLANYPMTPHTPQAKSAQLYEFVYNNYHSDATGAIVSIDQSVVNDKSFIYAALASTHSFIIMLNNPAIYLRKYSLNKTLNTDQYETFSKDTPRGMLRYNNYMTLPYVVFSGHSEHLQHTFSLDYYKKYEDVYKSVINPGIIPAPRLDLTSDHHNYPVELLEIYAA